MPHAHVKRTLLVVSWMGVVLAIAAFAFVSRPASADTSVEAGNDYFCSQAFDGSSCETDITAGDTVTWNVVAGSHTVTQCTSDFATCPPSGGFDSGPLIEGQTFSHTFDTPGTYTYRCELHPSEMIGTIVVAAAPPTPTPSPTIAATETGTPAPTVASLPQTGGAPDSGTSDAWTLPALGAVLVTVAGVFVIAARKRARGDR